MFQNFHSYHSLHYGTLSIEQIIELIKLYGYDSAAITDINNSTGVLDFVKHAVEGGIRPIVGMDFRTDDERFLPALPKIMTVLRKSMNCKQGEAWMISN
ncbi:MAG: PHP domain-containing protein [Chloroflexia bacterium]|nr:PHP domain-containing protein [Chloroflexia bacterium]